MKISKKLTIALISIVTIIITVYLIKLIIPEKWKAFTDPEKVVHLTFLYPTSWKTSATGDWTDTNSPVIVFLEKKCPLVLQWRGCPIFAISRSISNQYTGYTLSDIDTIDLLKNKGYILKNETVINIEKTKIGGIDAIMFDRFAEFGDIGVGSNKVARNYLFYEDGNMYNITYSEPIYLGNLFVSKTSDEWRHFNTIQKVIDSIEFN